MCPLNQVAIADSVTNSQPAVAMFSFAGAPTYAFAWKGPNATDKIGLSGLPSIVGALTDAAPALTVLGTYLVTAIYLAWKVAGSSEIEIRQCVLGNDGIPNFPSKWELLPVASGLPNPSANTDAAPAMSIGANGSVYVVWKTPTNSLEYSEYNGTTWSTPQAIPLANTKTNPALSGFYTEGPNSERPMCLAWMDAESSEVFWAPFTPGSSSFVPSSVPGSSTDAAPALAACDLNDSYYVVWKGKGKQTLGFALLGEGTTNKTSTTLPQAETNAGPAVVNRSATAIEAGEIVNSLVIAWKGKGTPSDDVFWGEWNTPPNPVPDSNLASSSNYLLYNCDNLKEVSVSITISQEIVCDGGVSFQLNCYSSTPPPSPRPAAARPAWQQYFFSFQVSASESGYRSVLFAYVDTFPFNVGETTVDFNSTTIGYGSKSILTRSDAKIPAGYVLTIALKNDTLNNNDNIRFVTFTVVPSDDTEVSPLPVPIDLLNPAPKITYIESDLAPIVAFELDVVGPIGGAPSQLSSGAGTITYTANAPLSVSSSVPSCAVTADAGTGEVANTVYSLLDATPSVTFTQEFWTSG